MDIEQQIRFLKVRLNTLELKYEKIEDELHMRRIKKLEDFND